MNRREFTKSLLAAASLPALPMPALAAAPRGVAIPASAKFWASYMTQMHDSCTPVMLRNVLKVDLARAVEINSELIAQNLITPSQAVGRVVTKSLDAPDREDLGRRAKELLERVTEADDAPQEQTDIESDPADD